MARKMKKFSAGGAQGRYDRRMADIKKDFEKDSKGKSGKALEVLEAKRAQRIADAEDDRAKRMGTDRTATRKAEYEAEQRLSRTRKFGADKPVAKAEPVKTTAPAAAPAAETAKAKPKSFGETFKAERARLGPGKTFTYNGKKFTTNIAGEGRKASTSGSSSTNKGSGTSTSSTNKGSGTPTSSTNKGSGTPTSSANKGAVALAATTPKVDTRFFSSPGANAAPTVRPNFITRSPQAEAAMAKARKDKEAKAAKEKAARAKYVADMRARAGVGPAKLAKGGAVKEKEKAMKYRSGGSASSKPPQPTAAERAAAAKFRKSVKDLKVTPENAAAIGRGNRSTGMAKGGKMATKFGAAMKKKSADTKGRAMMKKAGGGKCYASGGLVAGHKSADGIAKKGKTKGKMPTMARGGKTC